ncbi:hypothetical protein J6590_005022 [Homalodisca vitripennis]|nr:hypothetical protein J6590_005022 [Homalodisca vitripennis]
MTVEVYHWVPSRQSCVTYVVTVTRESKLYMTSVKMGRSMGRGRDDSDRSVPLGTITSVLRDLRRN